MRTAIGIAIGTPFEHASVVAGPPPQNVDFDFLDGTQFQFLNSEDFEFLEVS